MRRRGLYALIIAINISIFIIFLFQYTNASYPLVGHDYTLFIARLIDSHLYYRANGFGIEWYTPNFGGGLPAYPNPLQMQFSLPQLITWFINPYMAVFISTAIYIAIGFIFTFLLLNKVIGFQPLSAILGADFFMINGFMVERLVVGHVNFLTFPLIVIPIYAILNTKLRPWLAGILISLTGAAFVYSGEVYIAVIGLFAALMVIPLVYFLKPDLFSWKKMLLTFIWGGILTFLLCGSKLFATAEYMRFFPRAVHDSYGTNWITGLRGMVFQLVGVLNFNPILALVHKTSASYTVRLMAWTKTPYGFWELDSSIAPGLLILLIVGLIMLVRRKPHVEIKGVIIRKSIAAICLLFGILLTAQFSMAKGILYQNLSQLPVLESLHVVTRFTSSFIFPLALLGAKTFDEIKLKSSVYTPLSFTFLAGISLASAWSYFLMPLNIQNRWFDITAFDSAYSQSQAGIPLPVLTIVPAMNDYEVFSLHASNTTRHYDPLFRDNDILLTPKVHPGSVFDLQNGYYNMTNPSSLVYPEVNNAKPFDLIPGSDYSKLLDFVNHRRSDWKIPTIQLILDWLAGLTFIAEALFLLFLVLLKLKPVYSIFNKQWKSN